jgi:molecular chaperone HtpG
MKETVDMVVNAAHPLVQQLALTNDETSRTSLGQNLIDLALLSQGMLSGAPLAAFIERSLQAASKP